MVLFFVASGVQIGIGHVKRCTQLALELIKQHQKVVLCLHNDPKSIEIIQKAAVPFAVIPEGEAMRDELKKHKPVQLIVLDLLNISKHDTRQLKEQAPEVPVLALDYFDMEDSNVNTIINLHNHNKQFKRPTDTAVKYLEGPAYGILRNEFQLLLKDNTTKKTLKNILVTFGGSDPRLHTLAIIPVLQDISKTIRLGVTVVIGPNFIHEGKIIELLKRGPSEYIRVHDPANMSQLMHTADLCICGSGTTILELSALGTPALIVPQSKEELGFSQFFETAGFATIVGTPEGIDEVKLKTALFNYYDHPSLLEAASIKGPKLCDGKGKERIVDEIKLLLKNHI